MTHIFNSYETRLRATERHLPYGRDHSVLPATRHR